MQYDSMRRKELAGSNAREVNYTLVRGTVLDGVDERIRITREQGRIRCIIRGTGNAYFIESQNSPVFFLIVLVHALLISISRGTSSSGRSPIIQIQTSVLAMITKGVKTAKGKATK